MFHSLTAPLASALASLPSGLNATPFTALPACSGEPDGWPLARFQTRTEPSASALASSFPSGLNASPFTALPACRAKPDGWPLAGFHSLIVPSP